MLLFHVSCLSYACIFLFPPFLSCFGLFLPLCSHPDIPNCSPKRQILRCQLILAFLPRMEGKGHRKPLSMLLPLVIQQNKAFICGKHMDTFHCKNPASSDPSSLLFAFLTQNKMHSPSLLYSVWKQP